MENYVKIGKNRSNCVELVKIGKTEKNQVKLVQPWKTMEKGYN